MNAQTTARKTRVANAGTGAHTAGPWKVTKRRFGGLCVEAVNNPFGNDGILSYPICSDINGNSMPDATTGRPQDNARLIAAAPELLEALRNLITAVETPNADSLRELLAAHKAIARATGGAA